MSKVAFTSRRTQPVVYEMKKTFILPKQESLARITPRMCLCECVYLEVTTLTSVPQYKLQISMFLYSFCEIDLFSGCCCCCGSSEKD